MYKVTIINGRSRIKVKTKIGFATPRYKNRIDKIRKVVMRTELIFL